MIEDSYNLQSCNRAEQLVSFLYGEIDNAEKLNFERHLEKCSFCSNEAADFAASRTAIQEWRAAEFENLATPFFKAPFSLESENSPKIEEKLVDKLHNFFWVYKGWSAATAAAALVVIGFVWFTLVEPDKNEITQNQVITPINKTSPEPDSDDRISSDSTELGEKEIASAPSIETARFPVNKDSVKKISNRKSSEAGSKSKIVSHTPPYATAQKPGFVNTDKNGNQVAQKEKNKNKIQSLAVEDYQDDSLRLSDILDEVSMK